jgi:hypothetical protein
VSGSRSFFFAKTLSVWKSAGGKKGDATYDILNFLVVKSTGFMVFIAAVESRLEQECIYVSMPELLTRRGKVNLWVGGMVSGETHLARKASQRRRTRDVVDVFEDCHFSRAVAVQGTVDGTVC